MKKILHLVASPRRERSHSRQLADYFLRQLLQADADWQAETVELLELPPVALDETFTTARFKVSAGKPLNEAERRLWERVTAEFGRFAAADAYVISTPMWNFQIPNHLKHYLDLITHPNLCFTYDPEKGYAGLLGNKPLAVIYASGNVYNTPETIPLDGVAGYLKTWAQFVGLKVWFFTVDGNNLPINHAAVLDRCHQAIDLFLSQHKFQ
ncbi:FMN-dependent NADH-azoreductase [Victivallis sp. Marseille-Q1083]|uniref:FMN-dependent NADH-azoreductase n=1 Tax=Victivallis sp. Marseille-Q1083 TaxID=2717288 RepID=UPI00158EEF69|nr:NAD(P)H-dependent oxidoreductase [Victivallis sp. Marseille-Q1083]